MLPEFSARRISIDFDAVSLAAVQSRIPKRGFEEDRGRISDRGSSRHEVASLTANSFSGFEYIRAIREGLIGYETRIRFWSLTMTATKHVLSLYT